MSRSPMSRRALLQRLGGAGAVAALSPLVPLLESRSRAQVGYPKRLLLYYTGNGTNIDDWRPSGGERDFVLGRVLEPLEEFRDRLLVIDGIDNESIYHGTESIGHQSMGTIWTGEELLPGDDFREGNDRPSGWAGGPSIDQFIAAQIGGETRFRSLELAVRENGNKLRGRMIFKGANQPVPPIESPYDVFDRLFSNFQVDTSMLERLRNGRSSVLDAVRGDLMDVQRRISSADRPKLEAHLEALRAVETRLLTESGSACVVPTIGNRIDVTAAENIRRVSRLQMDLLARAFACDQTRVASFMWFGEVNAPSLTEVEGLDVSTSSFHAISHGGVSGGRRHCDASTCAREMTETGRWFSDELVYLLRQLDQIPEGNGTVLDHTVIVWGMAIAHSTGHYNRNVPFVVIGDGGGHFRTGRYLRFGNGTGKTHSRTEGGRTNNDLFASVCNAMDIETDTFGNANYCSGPITELT